MIQIYNKFLIIVYCYLNVWPNDVGVLPVALKTLRVKRCKINIQENI